MWERFTYYGMRAILILFLVEKVATGGFGLDDKTAVAIYGLYTASVYLAGLPGGWIADRLIGAQHAVLWGGAAITLGNAMLALSTTPPVFYLGLVVIVLGVGLLKPNVSTLVAHALTPVSRFFISASTSGVSWAPWSQARRRCSSARAPASRRRRCSWPWASSNFSSRAGC
jgi:dipeptide/tripeptide permease